MGAGHLKVGDKIKQADGTIVQQTQEMFNLTEDEAHTFYVGNNGWLVHNMGSLFNSCTGAFEKLASEHPLTELAANANQVFNISFPFDQYPNTALQLLKLKTVNQLMLLQRRVTSQWLNRCQMICEPQD